MWRDQRRLATELLRKLGMVKFGTTRRQLESRISAKLGECLIGMLERQDEHKCVDPFPFLHHNMGNTLNELVFGISFSDSDPTWRHLQVLQEEGVKLIGVSATVNFFPFLRHFPPHRDNLNFLLEGKKLTHDIYDRIIAKCQENITEYPDCILKSYLIEREKRETSNIESLNFCSDAQLRHLLADLFGAGVDTTLTTIRWFILYVGLDQDLQKELRDEMDKVIDHPRRITLDDYATLPLMRATIAETQRIRSVVPIGIPHGANRDTTIEGYRVSKDTMILPLLWAVHMNEKDWPEPEKFNPRWFLDSEGNFQTPNNFMPFQTGNYIF